MSDNTNSSKLELLLAEYVDRLNAGEAFNIEKIRADHPRVAEELIAQLRVLQGLFQDNESSVALGTLGDYTLRRQIGRGGMGVVYEAWENSMDRRVALKVLPAGVAADERALQRFVREAKTAGKLNHQNVVSVYGMGLKEQTPYFAMEFVEGETLAQQLANIKDAEPESDTPFGKKDRQDYFIRIGAAFADVADGLQHAHSKGVIHRDIKPSNLILDAGGRLRILDFGLARLEGQESLTVSGDLVGTPLYMSPEQARQRKIEIDHRTDVYSLGATMYEVITGRPPFKGRDHQDTLSQIIERDPVEPRKLNSRVPRELETVVLKCLRKDPADRYGTAEALAQDLRRFVRGDPVEARPESRLKRSSRRLRRHRIAVLAAGVLVVLFGALGWSDLQRRFAELEAREAARLLHDAAVCDAAVEISSGQLTLLGQDAVRLSCVWFIFEGGKFKKGPAGVQLTLSALDRAAELEAGRPDAPYYLARLYRLAGDEEAAGREAARALEREGDFVPAEVLTQESALGEGPLRESEIGPLLERFRGKPEPNWQEPWLQAYKHARSRAWPQAADAYGRLLEFREPEPYVGFAVEALMGRGIAYLNTGDFPGAVSDFAAARGIWPNLPEAGFGLGVAWRGAGQADQ
ncbi:MAG: serine/threonine protein kinase, partial [Spirochaetales bacterium]|nr:serine/threonine protein kinase [Spirochaetales bacterium]